MTRIFAFVLAMLLAPAAVAQGLAKTDEQTLVRPVGTVDLPDFLWTQRPVIVFADSPEDPRFIEQMELLEDDLGPLAERDVVILTDTTPADRSPLRLRLRPRGFMMVLVGKDGEIELRKPSPWTVREIIRSIDKMPIRQREIEERRG